MNFSYEKNENSKTITVRTTGNLNTKELAEMCVLIRKQAVASKSKIIFDYRLSKNFITITQAYYWFSDYYDVVDMKLRQITTAIITNKEDKEFFQFLETTCCNHGIPIKVFLEEEPAIDWLNKFLKINYLIIIHKLKKS